MSKPTRFLPFPTAMLAVATILGLQTNAHAVQVSYAAPLLGSNEVPTAVTSGTGNALVLIDLGLQTMRVQVNFSGLSGNTTAAHIHCGTNAGSNAGEATTTPSFTDFPAGVTSGSYDFTFDMALASSYRAGFITSSGGTVAGAFSTLVAGLDAGKAYFNLHTSVFPGGELRGNLTLVPEPTTYAMLLAGLGLVGRAARARTATQKA
jgi:CHRD domain/PEP-CTERM motif